MPTYNEWLTQQRAAATGANQQYQQAAQAYQAAPTVGQPASRTGSFVSSGNTQARTSPNYAGYNAMESARQNAAQFDPNSAANRTEGNRLQAYDLARGGIDRLANDQTDQFVRQGLQQAATAGNGPYDATTRNAMFTNAMESSGQQAQVQSIMDSAAERGMNPNDPSVQAALRRAQDGQAQTAQRARLGIDLQANRANYAAQQSGLDRLGGYNMNRQEQQTGAEDRLRTMLWNEGVPDTGRQTMPAAAPAPQWMGAYPGQQFGSAVKKPALPTNSVYNR